MEESDEKEKLIEELKEIISEYEKRLNTKDKNFQLQFSELQNELEIKCSEIWELTERWNKAEYQVAELNDLVQEKDSVIKSKDFAIQIMESDVREKTESLKLNFDDTLSECKEEIECLRMTSSQLRQQLLLRENDVITMMQRHEDQIIKMSQANSKENVPSFDHMSEILKEDIKDMRELLFQKQESLKVASLQLEEQDKVIRKLQDKILGLNEDIKSLQNEIKTEQNTHRSNMNDDIKENKKKQLSLKAKVKSIEKQLEYFKDLSAKEQEKNINLNKKMNIREELIEKQNTLIEELRQTEKSLRQNLERVSVLQQEQLIELCYWKDLQKYVIEYTQEDHLKDLDPMTPLQMAMDSLNELLDETNEGICDNIKEIIFQLKSNIKDICKYISHSRTREAKVQMLQTYVERLHQYNYDLHKQSKIFVNKAGNINDRVDVTEVDVNLVDVVDLSNCTKEDLVMKLLILTNNTVNYSESINKLEFEHLNVTIELNKIREDNLRLVEINERNEIKWLQEKEKISQITEDLRNNILLTDRNKCELNDQLISYIKVEEKLKKEIEQLREYITIKVNELQEKEEQSRDTDEQILFATVKEGPTINQEDAQENSTLLEKCNCDLSKAVMKLKEDILLRVNDRKLMEDRETLFMMIEQLEEDILLRDKDTEGKNDYLNITLRKNEEFIIREKELNDCISLKDKEIESKEIQCQNLNDNIKLLKTKIEELTVSENDMTETLKMVNNKFEELIKVKEQLIKENDQLIKENVILNDDSLLRNKEKEDSMEKLKFTINEKDTLLKTVVQIKEDIMLNAKNDRDVIEELRRTLEKNQGLMNAEKEFNDEIILLKLKIEGLNNKDNEVIKTLSSVTNEKETLMLENEQLMNEKDELIKQNLILNDDILVRDKSKNESMEQMKFIFEEKEKLLKIIEQMKEDILLKDKNYNDIQEKLKRTLKKNEELIIREEELNDVISLKDKKVESKEMQSQRLNDDIESLKTKIEELTVSGKGITETFEMVRKEKEELMKKKKHLMKENEELINEKDKLINENMILNDDILVRNKSEEESIKEMKFNFEEKENLLKIIEHMKDNILLKDKSDKEIDQRLRKLLAENERLIFIENQLKDLISVKDEEMKSKETHYRNRDEDIVLLKLRIEELIVTESDTNKALAFVMYEKEELIKEKLKYNDDDLLRDKYKEETTQKLKLVEKENEKLLNINEELKEELKLIEKTKEELSVNMCEIQAQIKLLVEENDTLMQSIIKFKNEFILKDEKYTETFENVRLLLEEKDNLSQTIVQLNDNIIIKNEETKNKDTFLEELRDEIISINEKLEEKEHLNEIIQSLDEGMSLKHNQLEKMNEDIKYIIIEKEELMKTIDELKDVICYKDEDKSKVNDKLMIVSNEKEDLLNEINLLKGEVVLLNELQKEKDEIYTDQQVKFKMLTVERNELFDQLKMVVEDKEDLMKEIIQCKEDIVSRNDELKLTMTEKKELSKMIEELKVSVELSEQRNKEKDGIIQKLENSNLLLKAKSLKFKKQYDEKLASLSHVTEGKPLISRILSEQSSMEISKDEEVDSCRTLSFNSSDVRNTAVSISIDTSDLIVSKFFPYLTTSLPLYNEISQDEMSFVNRIQRLSDEVESRARQANLEIERFLECNEQVTIGLSPDIISNRRNLCENAQCQRISSKNRDLSISIDRLREQNELMKNKIIDLQSCLEFEKETHKQISKEGFVVHDELIERLEKLTLEKDEIKLRFISIQEGLKESQEVLKQKGILVDELEEKLLRCKSNFDCESVELKKKENEIIVLNERLQRNKQTLQSLTEENNTICQVIQVLNNHIDSILVKYEQFFNGKIDSYSMNEILVKLQENIAMLKFTLMKTNADSVSLLTSFTETTKQEFLKESQDCTTKVESEYGIMIKNNHILKESLLSLLNRIDKIIIKCSTMNEREIREKCEINKIKEVKEDVYLEINTLSDKNTLFNANRNIKEFENKVKETRRDLEYLNEVFTNKTVEINGLKEVIISLQNDIEYFEILKKENVYSLSHCNSCTKLAEKIEYFKIHFINLIKDVIPTDDQITEISMNENDESIYNEIIRKINDKYKMEAMINQCTQTFTQLCDLNEMDDLIRGIMNEFVDDETKVGKDGFKLYIEGITEMKNQMVMLRDELKLEVQEKGEISDRFERLFIELETSCDSEMEELKRTIVLLNREIESLQSNSNASDNAIKDYKVQVSYLQSLIDKSLNSPEKDKVVPLTNSDNSQFWFSDLNDALKETISEKEDHITELMDQINECSNRSKEFVIKNDEQELKIQAFQTEIEYLIYDGRKKDNLLKENNEVINELEAVCVEKENRINLLEKESAEINVQLEQYVSAICSMQARLEESKPNLEFILTKIENKDNNMQILNLIDQLEKDYAEELEQSEINKAKLEGKLNKAIQIIHKLKKQLKESHSKETRLSEELKAVKLECHCKKESALLTHNQTLKDKNISKSITLENVSVQIEGEELRLLREENTNYKGIIENLHVNNFLLWKELDSVKKTDRNIRGSSLPAMNSSTTCGNNVLAESERSISPTSQLSWNSVEGNTTNSSQLKDVQRKLQRVHQQLNQMRIERNRIHQEYSRIRQLKEVADNKVIELIKKIDTVQGNNDIMSEKDELIKSNNLYSTQIVELTSEIEMTKVRNSILETKCKKIELKLTSQRRKYDQLVLRLDEKEQEIDRNADELRKNISNFEKDKIIWLREKKEMKSLLTTKDEKIINLRKRLSNKCNGGDNGDSEYLLEISQLESNLNEQILENKRISTQYREQMTKYHGQIEELIDDNRQLKRKLSLGYNDHNNVTIMESKKNENFGMDVIEEDSEECVGFVGNVKSVEKNTILANVVMEKEKLLLDILDLHNSLKNEKEKCSMIEEEIRKLRDNELNRAKVDALTQTLEDHCTPTNSITSTESHTMTDGRGEIDLDICVSSTQTSKVNDCNEQFSQTDLDFDIFYEHKFRKEQLTKCIDKSLQINIEKISNKTSQTQTQMSEVIDSLKMTIAFSSCSSCIQTDDDETVIKLHEELNSKSKLIEQYCWQVTNKDHQVAQLKCALSELSNRVSTLETENLEFQESIGLLELDQIDRDKKYKGNIVQLHSQIKHLVKQVESLENSVVEVTDKADQTLLHQPANEGWDMEWDYEKLTLENQTHDFDHNILEKVHAEGNSESMIVVSDDIERSIRQEEENTMERPSTSQNTQNNLIEILKDEIVQLKNIINDKNTEIGQLKSLRNKFENELLESGQQIKDSNMEFLNLKENVQVLHTERDMLMYRVEEVESQFSEMINFIEMVTADLRRLRDSSNEEKTVRVINENVEDSKIKRIVGELEKELHNLLEQIHSKDSKLQNAMFQIEQLTCAIHRMQLQPTKSNETLDVMNIQETSVNSTMTSETNIHDGCVASINELSELLEKKHLEIEQLKSRLFLATDQLIHFRTFFANPENVLHKELLLITRHHSLEFNEGDRSSQLLTRDHTRLVMDHDDHSDSEQSLISHDGNTVIRVERAYHPTYSRSRGGSGLLNSVFESTRYKRLMHNFKRVFLAGRRRVMSLRSQPRINLRSILTVYLVVIHLLVLWCLFM